MNKSFIYLLTAIVAVFASCTNENYLKYDTSWKDAIYIEQFETKEVDNKEVKEVIDSMFYNFGFDNITSQTINVRCVMMGTPKEHDRKIVVKHNNSKYADAKFSAATNDYYSIPETIVMPKGEVETVIPIKLLRHADLETKGVIITIEIVASDDFDVKINNEFTITFDDRIPTTPIWWTTYDMGAFTKFKGQLFFEYFWELETTKPHIYEPIIKRWGRNLDIGPFTPPYNNGPLVLYEFAFNSFVKMRMWEYSESHPELGLGISKPSIY